MREGGGPDGPRSIDWDGDNWQLLWSVSVTVFGSQPHHGTPRCRLSRNFVVREGLAAEAANILYGDFAQAKELPMKMNLPRPDW